MYTIIVLSIIGGIIGFLTAFNKINSVGSGFDILDLLVYLFTILLGSVLGGFFGFLIAISIPSKTEVVVDTHYLEAFQDNNSINGSFFLGSGNISGNMKYVYYYQSEDGYRMNQLSYNNVLIKYTNDQPKIEFYKNQQTDDFINKFSINLELNKKTIIYIPKGSIMQNYSLDAK